MTTKLTPQQALIALAEGKKLKQEFMPDDVYIWLSPTGITTSTDNLYTIFFDEDESWYIYQEPPTERLATTLEEALKASKLRIEWPEDTGKPSATFSKGCLINDYWFDDEIAIFHAALSVTGARVIVEEA